MMITFIIGNSNNILLCGMTKFYRIIHFIIEFICFCVIIFKILLLSFESLHSGDEISGKV